MQNVRIWAFSNTTDGGTNQYFPKDNQNALEAFRIFVFYSLYFCNMFSAFHKKNIFKFICFYLVILPLKNCPKKIIKDIHEDL